MPRADPPVGDEDTKNSSAQNSKKQRGELLTKETAVPPLGQPNQPVGWLNEEALYSAPNGVSTVVCENLNMNPANKR